MRPIDVLPILPQGSRLIYLHEIDSTNEEARRISQKLSHGDSELPVWVWALRQSAGRGRRGRDWVSEKGNLFCTQLRLCDTPPLQSAQLSFVAALAVIEALQDSIPELALAPDRLQVKWPNDVLLDGRKISGILLESFSAPAMPLLAIGIGINLTSHPSGTPFPSTDILTAELNAPELCDCLSAVAASLEKWSQCWVREGFAPIRRAWLDRAARLHEKLTITLPHETLEGTFTDVSENGELLLEGEDRQVRAIAAGEVFFPEDLAK